MLIVSGFLTSLRNISELGNSITISGAVRNADRIWVSTPQNRTLPSYIQRKEAENRTNPAFGIIGTPQNRPYRPEKTNPVNLV